MGQGALAALFALAAGFAHGAIVEETFKVPVEIPMASGAPLRHDMVVTVFRDDARAKAPFVIVNHGRASGADVRAQLGRVRYPGVALHLVERGFVVFLPTRVGYGVTGGDDVEFPFGRCPQWQYAATFEAAAVETLALVRNVRAKPYVDPERGVLMGTSYGGMTTIALAAKNPPGIVAGINFGGGAGGDPKLHPGRPCNEPAIHSFFADNGKRSRLPTLWLYSENDKFWGTELPVEWHKAYVEGGGVARYVRLPAYGEDGHYIFTGNVPAWKGAVDEFLKPLGF